MTRKLLFLNLRKGESEMPLKKTKLEPIETPNITVDNTKRDVIPGKVIGDDQECSSSLNFITVFRFRVDQNWPH